MARLWQPYEDSNFVAGGSPITLVPDTDLNSRAGDGYIICDGPGTFQVEIAPLNGSDFDPPFQLKEGDVFSLKGGLAHSIRLTHLGTDSAYRILVTPLGTDITGG